MQEIQDMLNRMDYLATQSANGTYDNEVDRANLQKEVEALKSEINRIADSSNFNGIKLLDGSLDPTATGVGKTDANAGTVTTLVSSSKGAALGTNTIEHQDGTQAAKTKFGVALHEVKFNNAAGEGIKISIGGDANFITIKGGAQGNNDEMTAKDIVDYLTAHSNEANTAKLEFGGNIAKGANAGEIVIDGETFTLGTADGGTTLTFEQKAVTTKHIDGDMQVKVTGAGTAAVKPGWVTGAYTAGTTDAAGTTGMQDDAKIDVVVTIPDSTGAGGADEDLSFSITALENAATADEIVAALKAASANNGNGDAVTLGSLYDITAGADNKITFTLKDGEEGTVKSFAYTADTGTAAGTDVKATMVAGAATTAQDAGDDPVTGDYNMKTTVTTQGQDAGASRIASGVATLAAKDFADKTIIKIGDKEYTVTTDKANVDNSNPAGKGDYIYVGDLDLSTDLQTAIDRLTVKAASNEVWTVGQGPTAGTITFVEKVNAAGKSYTEQKLNGGTELPDGAFDLTKESVIKETFGVVTGKTAAEAGKDGKELTLQIGDTADTYNRLEVKVGDMHTAALGIADLDISKPDLAKDAIDTIKKAINQVSSVRGDLGAVQNRLEHTANNLSVMAENIQDAESTIRDTDVAEEMMAYTKNNILIQSAQAMLAQANQVPQGVLQLLQ